jgi:hypothetical protein
MDQFLTHKENIKYFVSTTMLNFNSMYSLLSDQLDRKEINEHALYGYHSMAFSSFLTLKAYYLQNDVLSHWEFDEFIEKASQLSSEFVSSRETGHSMQWTFGYYHDLVEAYNNLAKLLDLNLVQVSE